MSDIQQLRHKLEQQKGSRNTTLLSLATIQSELAEKRISLHKHEEAREIIRKVGAETQSQLTFHIKDIVSLALDSVFDSPYSFGIDFVQRRQRTECDLYFERDGNRIDPMTASGVGAVDIASFALRIASWSMARPRTRNVIILDEPFRFLSENYQEQAALMLREISQRLGIQLIVITHNQTLTTYADRIFEINIKKGISQVKIQ
jgi:DNA repair exonuclease SbcCD ATPase subunit